MAKRRTDKQVDDIKISAVQAYVRASNAFRNAIANKGPMSDEAISAYETFKRVETEYKKAAKM